MEHFHAKLILITFQKHIICNHIMPLPVIVFHLKIYC